MDFFHTWHGQIFCMFWYRVGEFSIVFFLSNPGSVCFYTHTPYPSSQIILRSVYCFFPLSYHLRFVALSEGQRPAGAYCLWWGPVPPLFGDLKLSLFYSTRDRMHLRGSTHHYAWKRVHAAPLSAFTKSWSSFAAVTLERCFLLKCPLTQFAHSSTTWEGINDHSWMCGFRFFLSVCVWGGGGVSRCCRTHQSPVSPSGQCWQFQHQHQNLPVQLLAYYVSFMGSDLVERVTPGSSLISHNL